MATIRITDISLRTVIGINDWERECKQDVIINVSIDFDASAAARSDDIHDTIDYQAITKNIIKFVETSQFHLLERLAEKVLDIVMDDSRVRSASVKIDKPHALRFAKSVSVEMERFRQP